MINRSIDFEQTSILGSKYKYSHLHKHVYAPKFAHWCSSVLHIKRQQEILPAFANKKFEWLQFCIFAPWPLFVYTFITFRNKDSVL